MIIGICGPSNSGKSSLCEALQKNYGASWIEVDHYLKGIEDVPFLGEYRNWELPELHRFDNLYEDIQKLKQGEAIRHPIYAFRRGFTEGYKEITSKGTILVDGLYVFHDKNVRDLLDLRIYLELPEEELLRRRVLDNGQSIWANRDYIEKVVIPMYREYGQTQIKYADFVIDAVLPQEEVLRQVKNTIELFKEETGHI